RARHSAEEQDHPPEEHRHPQEAGEGSRQRAVGAGGNSTVPPSTPGPSPYPSPRADTGRGDRKVWDAGTSSGAVSVDRGDRLGAGGWCPQGKMFALAPRPRGERVRVRGRAVDAGRPRIDSDEPYGAAASGVPPAA